MGMHRTDLQWAREKVAALLVRACLEAVKELNGSAFEAASAAERIRRWALG
jgi:hypothetical protein